MIFFCLFQNILFSIINLKCTVFCKVENISCLPTFLYLSKNKCLSETKNWWYTIEVWSDGDFQLQMTLVLKSFQHQPENFLPRWISVWIFSFLELSGCPKEIMIVIQWILNNYSIFTELSSHIGACHRHFYSMTTGKILEQSNPSLKQI